MHQKICLITGANSGIGRAAAIKLATLGHKVIIGCRNKVRGLAALADIQEKSNSNDSELLIIDMSSQKSIKSATNELKSYVAKLDVLIHNAADFDISRKSPLYSYEKIETIWATNHIGPVLLTNLLLDNIKLSAQGRIITVASQGLMLHPFLRINFNDPEFRNGGFSVEKAYYQSKLAQIMYTYWLAELLANTAITANCIQVTNVKIDIARYHNLSKIMKFLYSIKSRFSISPERMAQAYTYLATSEDVNAISGKYFNEKNRIVPSSFYSTKRETIHALMRMSMGYLT